MGKSNTKKDRWLSTSIMFFFIIQSANSTLKSIFTELGDAVNSSISALSGIIILLILIKSLKYVFKRHPSTVIRSYLLFILIYSLSIIMNIERGMPVNVLLKESMLWTMIWWLPMGLIIYSIYDSRILYQIMVKWSYLLSVITLLSLIAYFNTLQSLPDGSGNYNMSFSYLLLLPLIIHLNEVFEGRYTKNVLWLVIEAIAILVYGTRAALLCIAVFMIFKVLFGGLSTRQKTIVIFLSSIIVVAFVLNAKILFADLESAGYSSRTLEMFTEGRVSTSEGRDMLRLYSISLIEERPLLGYGLGGDFAVLYEKAYGLSAKSGEFSSLTPHNGVLQLMMNFGVIIGSILSLALILSIFYIRKIKDKDAKTISIILCSIYIIPSLTVGDGIFIKPGIALYIYLILNCYYSNKNKRKIYEYSKHQTEGSQQQLVGA